MSAIAPKDSTGNNNRMDLARLCVEYADENDDPKQLRGTIWDALFKGGFKDDYEAAARPIVLCWDYAEQKPDYMRQSAITDIMWNIFKEAVKPAILEPPKVTKENENTVVTYPNGTGIQMTRKVLGRGLTKEVFLALGLNNKGPYAAAFVEHREIETMMALQGKRGIAQIVKFHQGIFIERKGPEFLMWMELYQGGNLEEHLGFCDLTAIKVIVKDLVYAIIALEGEDPQGVWIAHGDVKLANVLLKRDGGEIKGAYLIDFGSAALQKTILLNESIEEQWEKYGAPVGREGQRLSFMQWIFHPLKERLERRLKSTLTLTEICADDPKCHKVMGEMEKEYGHVFERRYHHIKD